MMNKLKIFVWVVPIMVILIADRPITRLTNELVTSKTFEIGVIVMILDVMLILTVGGLSFYTVKRIWNA